MSALDIWGQDELEKQTCLAEEQNWLKKDKRIHQKIEKQKKSKKDKKGENKKAETKKKCDCLLKPLQQKLLHGQQSIKTFVRGLLKSFEHNDFSFLSLSNASFAFLPSRVFSL